MQNCGLYRNNSDNIRFGYGNNPALQKTKFCKGYRLSNAVKIMLFISDVQNCIPIKLCKAAVYIYSKLKAN